MAATDETARQTRKPKQNLFLELRRLGHLLWTKGAHDGEETNPSVDDAPPEVKQNDAVNKDGTLSAIVWNPNADLQKFISARENLKEDYRKKFNRNILDETGPEGETLLHIALLMNSPEHDKIAEWLMRKRPKLSE
ncbi:hypothetical protein HDU67_005680 [Dinochytrium kinnereticum]|nr:hypothetical protein HDU67_005680 [Dinochytrium kinnereticum]